MTRKTMLAPREWPTSVSMARCSGVRRMIFSAKRMAKLSASAWACSGVSFRGQSCISMDASRNVFLMSVTSSGSRCRVDKRSIKFVGVIWPSLPERLTCQSGMNQTVWRAADAVKVANRTNAAKGLNNVFICCSVMWLKINTRQFINMPSSRPETSGAMACFWRKVM